MEVITRKINWKLRFLNKTVLLALIGAILTFAYQICGIFEIVPPVSENDIIEVVGLIVNVLVAVGVVVDPTTAGISDSENAMNYVIPNPDNDPDDGEELPQ